MTREIFWLTLSVVLCGLLWLPYMVDRIMVRGFMGAMDNPEAQGQAAIGLGAAALLRPHQRGRQSRAVRAAGSHSGFAQHLDRYNGGGLRGLFLGAARARRSSMPSAFRCCGQLSFIVGWLACAVLVLAIFRIGGIGG